MDLIVLDTNVVVSALRSRRGASHRILELLAQDPPFRICLSVPLVFEYESILFRDFGNSDARIKPILDYMCSVAELQEIHFLWRPFLRDPGDEMVLEVAVGAGVRSIVTHNVKDFDGVESKFGIQVERPGEFLTRLAEEEK
jgi:putative PIN family toxin of toxin-antitoxin system